MRAGDSVCVLNGGVDPVAQPSLQQSFHALVLGGVAWNTMVYLETLPAPHPQTIFAAGSHETVGSSGAGKALNLARLGFATTLWAMIGDDEAGTRIRRRLAANDVGFLAQADPLGTTRHVNIMDRSGERISIFANPGSTQIDVDTGPVTPHIEAADLVAVTILDHCRPFLSLARDGGLPVWCDIHDYDGVDPYHREFIEAADYLFLSSIRLPEYRRFMEERIERGAQAVVCTHGARGASGIDATGTWVDVGAAPVAQMIDSNGAGDAFFAGFAYSWLRNGGLADAMESGSLMAAAAVASPELAPAADAVPQRFGR